MRKAAVTLAVLVALASGNAAGALEVPDATAGSDGEVTLSGVLTTVYEDPRPGSSGDEGVEYTLTEDSGDRTGLLVVGRDVEGERDGLPALDGERVEVVASDAPGTAALEVQEISPAAESGTTDGATAQAAAEGVARPTATILCRFADSAGTTPKPKSHFETLMGLSRPGMDHYWREASYGGIHLTGSRVFGWYDLPNPESYYEDAGGNMQEDRLRQDCTGAADADVYFPGYTNVNVIVNTYYVNYALGGTTVINRDGRQKVYGFTWVPRWGYQKESGIYGGQFILAHEMGHSFGLPHSSGPYTSTYDSGWDLMSDGSACSPQDPQFGCLAVHTIAAHKDRVGWIEASRKYTATTAANQAVTLECMAQPGSSGYLMVKIPISGSSTRYYTVEARRMAGYDEQLPADAVVIHKVDTTNATGLTPIAKVVDPDNNGNPNDSGARWLPGETFTDAANGISVRVDAVTPTGYTVTINPQENVPSPAPPPDTVAPGGDLTINGGARKTSRLRVRLSLPARDDAGGTGVRQMRLANGSGSWSAWRPYDSSVKWRLRSGTGKKIVHAQFRDGAGNLSPRYSDSIRRVR